MTTTKTPKQIIKRHGGKGAFNGKLAKWIISHMPPHKRFLDAYFGSGIVTLMKPHDGIAEWANDTDDDLMQFWYVMQHRTLFAKFQRLVEAVPLSEQHFSNACKKMDQVAHAFAPERPPFMIDAVRRAAWFFIRARMSRQGLGKDYCTPTSRTRRGMNEQVSAWLSAVEGLPDVHERLKRVEVWDRPAIEAIMDLDGPDLLAYLDPPYLHATRSSKGEYGNHEMTEDDHSELLKVIWRMKGNFILSGYQSEMYDDFASRAGWRREEFKIPNNASSSKTKQVKTECIWMNF